MSLECRRPFSEGELINSSARPKYEAARLIPGEALACYAYRFNSASLPTQKVRVCGFAVVQILSYFLSPSNGFFFSCICVLLSVGGYHSYFRLATLHNTPSERGLRVVVTARQGAFPRLGEASDSLGSCTCVTERPVLWSSQLSDARVGW